MAVYFWYLVNSELSSVRYCTVASLFTEYHNKTVILFWSGCYAVAFTGQVTFYKVTVFARKDLICRKYPHNAYIKTISETLSGGIDLNRFVKFG